MAQNLRDHITIDAPADGDSPFSGHDSEHIYIEDVFADSDDEPRTVSKKLRIRNRTRGIVTELTLFEEGFLQVREGTPKKILKDHVLELRFLDPEPVTESRRAKGWLWASASAVLAAGISYFVMPMTGLSGYSFASTTVLSTLAVLAVLMALYRSYSTIQFVTVSGRAEVLRLVGSFGCIRRVRRASRAIRRAIAAAGDETGVHDVRYLRAEMQAHYRLREKGVISQEECSDGTAQILAKFG